MYIYSTFFTFICKLLYCRTNFKKHYVKCFQTQIIKNTQ